MLRKILRIGEKKLTISGRLQAYLAGDGNARTRASFSLGGERRGRWVRMPHRFPRSLSIMLTTLSFCVLLEMRGKKPTEVVVSLPGSRVLVPPTSLVSHRAALALR